MMSPGSPMSPVHAFGDDGFLSCCEGSPTENSRFISRKIHHKDSAPLFPRVPKEQREACLNHLSPEKTQILRDVAKKLEGDSGYCAELTKMGVPDPVHAMEEFGRHFNGYDIGAFRFLSGNGWDIRLTEKKLLNTIRWRALELPKHLKNPNLLSELIEKRLIPNIGWDEQMRGRLASDESPIEYWALQLANLKNAYDTLGEEGVKHAYVQYLEMREATMRSAESMGMFVIIDCHDVPIGSLMWHVSYFTKFFSCVGSVGEVYYPQSMTKCIVGNAPTFIEALWTIAKAALTKATKDMILITRTMDDVKKHCDMKDIEFLKQTILAQAKSK